MDVRIKGKHEQVLLELARRNGLPTPVAMTRMLIQKAAEEAGIWADNREMVALELEQRKGCNELVA